MKIKRLLGVWVLLTLFSALISAASLPNDVFPLGKVMPGMKGYGLTVFKGTKIERFNVTVLGVLPNQNNGRSLILIKMSGGPITQRQANIIGGMSGSPVFLNGKIVGAVAYGFGFPKEPQALVTPLQDMIEALDPMLPNTPSFALAPSGQLTQPVTVNGKYYTNYIYSDTQPNALEPGTAWIRPLPIPMSVSGLSPRGQEQLAEALKPFHINPVFVPSGKTNKPINAPMTPGAAVGVSLAYGDTDITGIGTLTYRMGDKLLLFGHPMLAIGALDAALTSATIVDVFPSYENSNKMGVRGTILGRIFQDRPWSVAGQIGVMPKMIPVTVIVDDKSGGRKRSLNTLVMNHPILTSTLIGVVVADSISQVRPVPGDATAIVHFKLDTDNAGTIERDNVYFDSMSIPDAAVTDLRTILTQLSQNPFETVGIKKLTFNITLNNNRQTAAIDQVITQQATYNPGDMLAIKVALKRYKSETVYQEVTLDLPQDLLPGRYSVEVRGGNAPRPIMLFPGLFIGGGPSSNEPPASDIKQIVKRFNQKEKNTDMVVRLMLNRPAAYARGEKLSNLPPTMLEVLGSSASSTVQLARDDIKKTLPMQYIVSGSQMFYITVVRKDSSDQPQPPTMPSFPSASPSMITPMPTMSSMPISEDGEQGSDEESVKVNLTNRFDIPPSNTDTFEGIPEEEIKMDFPVPPAASATPSAMPAFPTPSVGTSPVGKPVTRQVQIWRQSGYDAFSCGEIIGTTVTSNGMIKLAPVLKPFASLKDPIIWSMVSDNAGHVYAGTGHDGVIYVLKDDKFVKFAKLPDQEVTALCVGSDGQLYAGASPSGVVYKIGSDGSSNVFAKTEQRYVLSLLFGQNGVLYAGSGANAWVVSISPSGMVKPLLKSNDSHITSLTLATNGDLYAGTSDLGLVYRIKPSGQTEVIYDSSEATISGLAADDKGNLFVGTSPRGLMYRIGSDGVVRNLKDKPTGAVRAMMWDGKTAFSLTAGAVWEIGSDDTVAAFYEERPLSYLSMAKASDGTFYIGTGSAGEIMRATPKGTRGTYISPVHDVKLTAKWSRIEWVGDEGITLSTRTGNTREPDSTWSAWSIPYASSGMQVLSQPARFVQYKAVLSAGATGSPALTQVSISFLPQNQPPVLKLASPSAGDVLFGKQTVRWEATDPDGDTLDYRLYYSADEGQTWQLIEGSKKNEQTVTITSPTGKDGAPTEAEMLKKLTEDINTRTDISDSTKKMLLAQAPEMVKKMKNAMPDSPVINPSANTKLRATSLEWDTSKVKDGQYQLKVVASDRPSNGNGALDAEIVSALFKVVNATPSITVAKDAVAVQSDKSVTVMGFASQSLLSITAVQFRVDNGDWLSAEALNGVFDEGMERFTFATEPLFVGSHTIEVQAFNSAGNSSTTKLTSVVK